MNPFKPTAGKMPPVLVGREQDLSNLPLSVVGRPSVREAEEALRVAPKASLGEYAWDELKAISRAIAGAGCHAEGLAIARFYHLVDHAFRLGGDTKDFVLEDGTAAAVRILGFRHDERADGSGRAGITFEFANACAVHRMNANWTNRGGWQESEMRDWLNADFFGMLPQELSANVVEVEKRTFYQDETASGGYVLHVAGTLDWLWLLSMREVYGKLSAYKRNVPRPAAIYDEEGRQYQLYTDKVVSVANYGFCKKEGAGSWWWLRSPDAIGSGGFLYVHVGGDWLWNRADRECGVSPGFCF